MQPFRQAESLIPTCGTLYSAQRKLAALGRNGSMARADKIRGLERGLRVLQTLQSSSILSLQEIHQATRISKPSLLRILNTLEHVGFVSRRLADGHYRISAFARMGRKRDRYDRVAEAAAPDRQSVG